MMHPKKQRINPQPISEICCVSTGRTGTNVLFNQLKGCQELLVHYEVFNPGEAHVDWNARDLILEKQSISRADLDEMARTNKGGLLDLLREARDDLGYRCMIYKVFPTSGHLDMQELEELIIGRPGVGVLVVIRNPLKVLLSVRKAMQAMSYSQVDTTAIVVKLPPDEVIHFVRRSTRACQTAIELCNKHCTPYTVVSYESLFEIARDQAPVERLLAGLNSFMDPPLQHTTHVASALKKQDKATLADSIANLEELSAALERQKYGVLLNDSVEYQAVLGLREGSG